MKKVYVYENWMSDEPSLLGTLYIDVLRGSEVYSFEFDETWLNNPHINILDPNLHFYSGRQYINDKNIFGLFSDSAPDRWGRLLLNRRERIIANNESRKPNKLYESDYLLGVYDETRMGGLRFKTDKEGDFLSSDRATSVPPWTTLRTLEEAARNFESDDKTLSTKWLNQLIKPGSSLGGARPKASVKDQSDQLWIAKFPSKNDDYDIGVWEKIAHDLAKMCGLNVVESKIEKFSQYGTTFLIKRFDRNKKQRIHFSSAMTMLGKKDGDNSSVGVSYLDIVSFIKSYGASPKKDLKELWKRIVFNMAISNTDDHLRNHGFLLTKNGWELSPLYDINPIPYGNELSLNITKYDNTIDINLAIEVAEQFGLSKKESIDLANKIITTVNENWKNIATKYGLSKKEMEYMVPAFSTETIKH